MTPAPTTPTVRISMSTPPRSESHEQALVGLVVVGVADRMDLRLRELARTLADQLRQGTRGEFRHAETFPRLLTPKQKKSRPDDLLSTRLSRLPEGRSRAGGRIIEHRLS